MMYADAIELIRSYIGAIIITWLMAGGYVS